MNNFVSQSNGKFAAQETEVCYTGLQHMQHLDVWPFRNQPCSDPPFYESCGSAKKERERERALEKSNG